MKPEAVSEALLAAAPHVSRFVDAPLRRRERGARLDRRRPKERELALALQEGVREEAPLQGRPPARRGRGRPSRPPHVARRALVAMGAPAARARHAAPTTRRSPSRARCCSSTRSTTPRARPPRPAARSGRTSCARARRRCGRVVARGAAGGARRRRGVRVAADARAIGTTARSWRSRSTRSRRGSTARRKDHHDPRAPLAVAQGAAAPSTTRTSSSSAAPDEKLPELFVGPDDERRARDGFALTDRRWSAREVEQRGRLLPLLPRPRQGLVHQGPARQQDRRAQEEPARRRRSTAARSTRRSARCT